MLSHISINSLTLVDQLDLEFSDGMTVVTGETGAGKSILLGALGLAIGDRADSSLIANGSSKADISAIFDLTRHEEALNWLTERELQDGYQCILRRTISRDGRSRAFVNGSPTTVQELKKLSEMLLDIHSQHEHQSLLKKDTHIRLLDEFGGLENIVSATKESFIKLRDAKHRLKLLISSASEQSAKFQLLSYQSEELSALKIQKDETKKLEDEHKRLSSAGETLRKLSQAIEFCSDNSETGASHQLASTLKLLSKIEDDSIKPIAELIASALIHVDEAALDLASVIEQVNSNPSRQKEVENRLDAIYEISRKHKVQPDQLMALTEQIDRELDQVRDSKIEIEKLEKDISSAEEKFKELATKLSDSRREKARKLQVEITKSLQDLGMNGAKFEISLDPSSSWSESGLDEVEFKISTIPGARPAALSKIASGGELSRISLAIQVVTAKTSQTPTLIFDEVDVGVGGATAEVIGSLLRKLGTHAQIVCVTHLPQVAAQGHHHYVVAKSTTKVSAKTTVTRLTEESRVGEIARMLGGLEKTDLSIAHAKSMISGVASQKPN